MELNTDPKDTAELSATLKTIQTQLGEVTELTKGGIAQAAADIKAAHETAKQAAKDAELARALAQDAMRTAPAPGKAALETLQLVYNVDDDRTLKGRVDPQHYNLIRMTKGDLAALDEKVQGHVRRFQLLHDLCSLYHQSMLGLAPARAQEYLAAGGLKSTKLWLAYQGVANILKAAGEANDLTDTSAWVPTGVGAMVIDDVRARFELLGYIDTVPMPRSPYLYPTRGVGFRGYRVPENTAQAGQTQIGVRAIIDSNMTFTAETIGAMAVSSMELEQDAIVAFLTEMRNDLAFAALASEEYAIVDGQVSAAGSPSTFDTGYNVTTVDDLYCWDGLRYGANLVGGAVDMGTGITDGTLRKMIALQKVYGRREDNIWVSGYTGFAQLLGLKDGTGRSLVLIPGDYGAAATLVTGSLAALFGSPLVISDAIPEDLNAAGVRPNDGSAQTEVLRFNRRMWKLGRVMLPTIETSREQFWQFNQVATKINLREDFQPVATPSSTVPSVVAGVNVGGF